MNIKSYYITLGIGLITATHAATTVINNATPYSGTPTVMLDVTGDGVDDISFVVALDYAGSGGTDSWYYGLNADGDSVSHTGASISSITSLNTDVTVNSVTFDAFTSFGYRAQGNNSSSFELELADGTTSDVQTIGTTFSTYTFASPTESFILTDITGTSGEIGNAQIAQVKANFTVDYDIAVVPEPSSTALLGFGGLALLGRRKRS